MFHFEYLVRKVAEGNMFDMFVAPSQMRRASPGHFQHHHSNPGQELRPFPVVHHHFIISSSLPTQICNDNQCISMRYVNIVTTLGKGRILQPCVNC